MSKLEIKDIPDLKGKVIVITGASGGLGLEATKQLSDQNATIVMACRNPTKTNKLIEELKAENPNRDLHFVQVDVAQLENVKGFPERYREAGFNHADVVLNNAGVMAIPKLEKNDAGHEMQLAVNNLGSHAFAIVCIPFLKASTSGDARLVWVSSLAHKSVSKINYSNIKCEKRYKKWDRYGETKLGNIYQAFGFDRKFREANIPIKGIACHPGYSSTDLQNDTEFNGCLRMFAQTASKGALPLVAACVHPKVEGGQYVGPRGSFELWGEPAVVKANSYAYKTNLQDEFIEYCSQETDLSFSQVQ